MRTETLSSVIEPVSMMSVVDSTVQETDTHHVVALEKLVRGEVKDEALSLSLSVTDLADRQIIA